MVSLVRSISWDPATKQLVSFPVVEYETHFLHFWTEELLGFPSPVLMLERRDVPRASAR